jgi:predicted anti-sigma-YlaC factor YlaD
MTLRLHPRSCERAREWASLRLDGELSDFEQALLDAHLERCAPCADYARNVTAATEALRRAEASRLSVPIALPLRRRALSLRTVSAGAAAAAIVAAVGLGTLIGSLGGAHPAFQGVGVDNARASVSSELQGEQALIQEPKLAMLRAKAGIGKQRGLGIADV